MAPIYQMCTSLVICPTSLALDINKASIFSTRLNNKGDMGSPYLKPFFCLEVPSYIVIYFYTHTSFSYKLIYLMTPFFRKSLSFLLFVVRTPNCLYHRVFRSLVLGLHHSYFSYAAYVWFHATLLHPPLYSFS
jgi:hypothetical protein